MSSMNIQRFHAPTAREALALARAAFGDATLILSNRQVPNGVEVVAAAEGDLTSLELTLPPPNTPASTASAMAQGAAPARPVAAAPSSAPAGRQAAPRGAAPAQPASTQEMVRADTEQLSMSTLSFQDYVRERMLRRQHEAGMPAPAAASAPAAPSIAVPSTAALPAVRDGAPAFLLAATATQPVAEAPSPAAHDGGPAMAAAAPRDSAPAAGIETHATQPARAAAEGLPAARPLPGVAAPAAPELSRVLMAELQAMKRLMEDRFNTLSWLGQARQDPIHSNLMLKLVRAGYSPALARSVLEPIGIGADANQVVREVMAALESRLHTDREAPSMAEEGGVFALIGATGVGKTTTAAKLAAQCVQLHGAASVGLVTLDTQRAGAHEQLRAFGRGLGVVAHLAHDRAALQELLALLGGKKLVLVDTAGIAPRDPRRRDLLDLLDFPAIKRVLVLNAGAHGDTLDEVATHFKIGGARQAILSKVDEAAKLGPALDTLMRHGLALRGVTNGQRVPQDWKPADGHELIRESMRAAQRTAFDPRTADMDFYFSPATCGV